MEEKGEGIALLFAVEVRKTWITKRTPFWKQWRQSNGNKAPDSFLGRMVVGDSVESLEESQSSTESLFNGSMNWLILADWAPLEQSLLNRAFLFATGASPPTSSQNRTQKRSFQVKQLRIKFQNGSNEIYNVKLWLHCYRLKAEALQSSCCSAFIVCFRRRKMDFYFSLITHQFLIKTEH